MNNFIKLKQFCLALSLFFIANNSYAREGHGGKAYLVLILGIGIIFYTIIEHYYYKFRSKSFTLKLKNITNYLKKKFQKYKKFTLVIFATIFLISFFMFFPIKTNYYQCEYYNEKRSLIINKYLPNNYSIVISNSELKPYTIKKKYCQNNIDSVGFECKFKVPMNEDIKELLETRKRALVAGDKQSANELDAYIATLPFKKYLYRFDPILNHLKVTISSADASELSNKIYNCSAK